METLSPAAIAALMPLLEREAPRYTSYPSAHHFRELGPETQAAWLSRLPAGERVGDRVGSLLSKRYQMSRKSPGLVHKIHQRDHD